MTTRTTSASARISRRNAPISRISVKANKSLKSIELFTNDQSKDVHWERSSEKALQATFNPLLDVFESSSPQITLILHYHYHLGPVSVRRTGQEINIQTLELVGPSQNEGGEGREWRKSYGEANVIIYFQHESDSSSGKNSKLPSTTEGVIMACPRFRILVIGKTGVGKSSVINVAFGIKDATVSDLNAGVSDINKEIISDDNEQFVLHDSQGFEPGEDSNFEIVKKFIESRNAMPDIKDKIHAIWLCFGIPRAGARILETGIEEFFQLETHTPIIAVFTKYDLLTSRMKATMPGSRTLDEDAKKEADEFVKKTCVEPLEKAARKEVPNVTVSTKKKYEYTLSNLIRVTYDLVKDQVAMEASVITAIAQRVDPGVNIEGCIAVGRMKYWNGLASSANFANKALEKCLDVIHDDIITVWSLNDPHRYLCSKEFRALITNLVDDLRQRNTSDPMKNVSAGASMVGTIAGIVATFASAAAPIVLPLAACFVLARWVYDVYQESHDTLRRLMAYIVDLTLVMQNIFWLTAIFHVPVSRRLVKFAYIAYKESIVMSDVHEEIKQHVQGQGVLDRLHRDSALNKIVELLHNNYIDTAEMFGLKDEIGSVNFSAKDDEFWIINPRD